MSVVIPTMFDYVLHIYLQLNCKPPTSSAIRTIPMSTILPSIGQTVVISGWGRTQGDIRPASDTLRKIELQRANETDCRKRDGLIIDPYEFCAGLPSSSTYQNACYGDSGGPITRKLSDKNVYLIGIVSHGPKKCNTSARYSAFLKLSYIRNLFHTSTRSAVKPCPTTTSYSWKCFPPTSKVLLETNVTTTVSSLKPGDRVMAMSSLNRPIFSEFLGFIHLNQNEISEYLLIMTDHHTLHISPRHLIYISDHRDRDGFYDFVENLVVGQYVMTTFFQDGFLRSRVTAIHQHQETGVYAPLTSEGTIVVDGVVVSCYADVPYHTAAHVSTWPYRMWKLYVDSTGDTHGIPIYFKILKIIGIPIFHLLPFT